MTELLDVVDDNDQVIGREDRKVVHTEGLLHRETHIWFYTPDGQLVLQIRGKNASSWPNLLDATVGGHVDPDEDYIEAALREAKEETGLDLLASDLVPIGKVQHKTLDPVTGTNNNAFKMEYAYLYKGDVADLKVEEGKAEGFECVPIDTLLNSFPEANPRIIPGAFRPEFQEIFRKIKELL